MAEQSKQQNKQQNSNPQRNDRDKEPPRYTGGVGAVLRGMVTAIVTFVSVSAIAIAIEYGLSIFGLVDGGADHSRIMLIEYYKYLVADHSANNYFIDPMSISIEMIDWFTTHVGMPIETILQNPATGWEAWFYVIVFVFCTILIKVGYVLSSLPLVVLVWACMIVDGVILRVERTYRGGRDSGYKWALAMHMVGVPLVGFMLLYIVVPLHYHPTLWLLPVIFLSGYGLRSAVINFSKFW